MGVITLKHFTLRAEMGSLKSCFLTQSDNLCLSVEVLILFIFNVSSVFVYLHIRQLIFTHTCIHLFIV